MFVCACVRACVFVCLRARVRAFVYVYVRACVCVCLRTHIFFFKLECFTSTEVLVGGCLVFSVVIVIRVVLERGGYSPKCDVISGC